MKKIMITASIALALIITGIVTALAAEVPATPTDQSKSLAETMFGWEKTGEKYNLRACTVVTLDIKGVERNIVTRVGRKHSTVDIKNPNDGSVLRTIDAEVYYDFRDENQIVFKYGFDEHYIEDTQDYFGDEYNFQSNVGRLDIKYYQGWTFEDFVKYLDIPEETKEYINERIKHSLTEDEIAEILLMLRSINNWYTKDNIVDMTESEYANIPDTRDGEYIFFNGVVAIEIIIHGEERAHKYLLGTYIRSEETNELIVVEVFDGTYLMDSKGENINYDAIKAYLGTNDTFEVQKYAFLGLANMVEGVKFRPYYFKSIEEMDGKEYYNLEVIRIGYGKLNPENLPDKYLKEGYQEEPDGN